MRSFVKALIPAVVLVLTLVLALPAQGAVEKTVKWVCIVPGEVDPVTFVSAPGAALHGITQANAHAGPVFQTHFDDLCHVESSG